MKVIVYEQIGLIGIQEKYTYKYYMIRINNYSTIGIVDIPKGIQILYSLYLANYSEIILVLSDKSFAFIDRLSLFPPLK
jgi:hypothetical protein